MNERLKERKAGIKHYDDKEPHKKEQERERERNQHLKGQARRKPNLYSMAKMCLIQNGKKIIQINITSYL